MSAKSSWKLADEVGGEAALLGIIRDLYDRLFADMMIGFFFQPHDKSRLIQSQYDYLTAHLGDRSGIYEGPSIRRAHETLPILSGHFDRRHQILLAVLQDQHVPAHIQKAWIEFDLSLRDLVVREGKKVRDSHYT
jgi:hemoglobin